MTTTAPVRLMALLLALLPAGPVLAAAAPAPIDPTSELAPPPFEITGPENLEEAIEKARSIEHPDYKEQIRYRRTTHISFPLSRIDNPDDMSRASIAGALDMAPATPGPAPAVPEHALAPVTADAARPDAGTGSLQPPPLLIDEGSTRGWTQLSIVNH